MFVNDSGAQFFTVSYGGGGQILVGIGGWTGNWAVWADVFGLLSTKYRTVGIDHRGAGATFAQTEGVTIEQMAEDLLSVLDRLAIQSGVLAAESSGGAVALLAASKRPERFDGLVLSGALYYRPPSDGADPFLELLEQNYESAVHLFVRNCMPETDNPAMHHWGRQVLASTQTAALDLYRATHNIDLRSLVSQVATPVLLLHGDADRIISVKASQWLEAHLPDGRLHILPNAGHAPMMTSPHAVSQLIDEFASSFRKQTDQIVHNN